MNGLIDRFDAFAERHARLLMIIGGAWFVLSWAASAKFVDLPDIPFLTDRAAIFVSTGYNAIWWGFFNPRIHRRRKQRAALTTAGAKNG